MSIYNNNFVDVDLDSGSIFRSFMHRALGVGDGNYNRFGVRVFRNGQPVSLNGYGVRGQFIRPVGDTVTIYPGTVSGNEASVILPAACYAYEGNFQLSLILTGTNYNGTVRIVDGTIVNTAAGNVIDPGSVVPALDPTYLQAVADAEAAVATLANYSVTAVLVSGDNYNIVVNTQAGS